MTGKMKNGIRQRGKRSWEIAITLGCDPITRKKRYKWHSVKGTRRVAERERRRLLHEQDTGVYVEPNKMTVAAYLERWLRNSASLKVGRKTFERYGQIVSMNLIPALGALPLAKLRPIDIEAFYAEAMRSGRYDGRGGLSAQTVLHCHRVLSGALKQGVKLGLLARNPADAVDPPAVPKREMQTINEAETAWLFTAAQGTRLYVPVVLEVTTGLRRGEVLALRWSDLNLAGRIARVQRSLQQTKEGLYFKSTKSEKGRPVTLLQFTVDVLNEYQQVQHKERALFGADYEDNDLVCPMVDGRPWPPDWFSSEFRRFRKKLGLKIRYHDLRHSHATQLMGRGIHPKVVSERLGHSSINITLDLYSHVLPNMQEEAAQKMDTALREAMEEHRRKDWQ